MRSARTYWVGLPVGITVREDGGVSYEIDLGEAGDGMREEWGDADESTNPTVAAYTENEVLVDSAIVDAHPGSGTINLQPAVAEMRCPVRYSCTFRTFTIPDLVAHLEAGEHD